MNKLFIINLFLCFNSLAQFPDTLSSQLKINFVKHLVHKNRIEDGAGNANDDHTQGKKYLHFFAHTPLIDPVFAKHFYTDKNKYNRDTLLQVIEPADGAAQQEKQRP